MGHLFVALATSPEIAVLGLKQRTRRMESISHWPHKDDSAALLGECRGSICQIKILSVQ